MTLIPIIELCHYCPGIVTAMGVSLGLAGGTIMKQGTPAQRERWALDLLTTEKVGAWAETESWGSSAPIASVTVQSAARQSALACRTFGLR